MMTFPEPSFSIGLTQLNETVGNAAVQRDSPGKDDDPLPVIDHDAPLVNRKSKRARVAPRNLVGDYECDKRFLTRAWESFVNATCTTTSIDYAAKVAVLLERLASSL